MRKKLIEKRLQTFRDHFGDMVKTSKNGSIYVELNKGYQVSQIEYGAWNITKGTLSRFGETKEYKQTCSTLILLTLKAKMLIKIAGLRHFKAFTIKDLYKIANRPHKVNLDHGNYSDDVLRRGVLNKLADVFFIGRKYDWMRNHEHLWSFPYFTGFPSFGDAKRFLGFGFISDRELDLILRGNKEYFQYILQAKNHNEKVNILKLIHSGGMDSMKTLSDYIRMRKDRDLGWTIPRGKNTLKRLHDDEVFELNKRQARGYPKRKVYYRGSIFNKWKEAGLKFEVMDTPRSIFYEGTLQKHCIGSYARGRALEFSLFTRFFHGENIYDLQLGVNPIRVVEFKGKYNCNPPRELREKVELPLTIQDTSSDDIVNLEVFREKPEGFQAEYPSTPVPEFETDDPQLKVSNDETGISEWIEIEDECLPF